jgi:hypothetical protein
VRQFIGLGRNGGSPTPTSSEGTPPPTPGPSPDDHNAIHEENQLPGTSDWRISDAQAAGDQIQGYGSAPSTSGGQTLTFYVSVRTPGIHYTAAIYRLGWYGGTGGRLMTTLTATGQAQGYFDETARRLTGCARCRFDAATGLLEANWQPSLALVVPLDWTTGVYVARLATTAGNASYVPFVVDGSPYADYAVTLPDTTVAAYNDWGGYSLYHGPPGLDGKNARKVSLDRPALNWRYGLGTGLPHIIDAIRWLERGGYDLSYLSDFDVNAHPGWLLDHRAYMALGHDEYWTKTMRDGVERARDAGVGLAFLGANDGYWQIRLEADSLGVPDRTVVCYRLAALDPLYHQQNALVTVEWRQAPVSRPENALMGIMYLSYAPQPRGWSWYINPAETSSPVLASTGLRAGVGYGCDMVGYEWDVAFDNGQTPPGLHVLAISYPVSHAGVHSISETAYYTAPSHAFVFASGSITWSYGLDDLYLPAVVNDSPGGDACLGSPSRAAVPGVQRLMANIMARLVAARVRYVPRATGPREADGPGAFGGMGHAAWLVPGTGVPGPGQANASAWRRDTGYTRLGERLPPRLTGRTPVRPYITEPNTRVAYS